MAEKSKNLYIQGIKITNPDKMVYTESCISKEDVVRYYDAVASRMLPYVQHRLISAVRCPQGIASSCFFKKHPHGSGKGIRTIAVTNSEKEQEEYFYIETAEGLIQEAQMGTLEFHIWGSKVMTLEQPDMMVFDLDPDEGLDLASVRQGVRDLRSILDELQLTSYLKTSGGKGYHVVVPLKPSASWDDFHTFAQRVAQVMEKQWPKRYTSNIRKSNRQGKIFIDWQRNGRGATSVAPYSLRARTGAKVSMPISWDELETIDPDGVDLHQAIKRIKKRDPWEGFFSQNQSLQ